VRRAAEAVLRTVPRAISASIVCAVLVTAAWAATLDDQTYAIARQLMCPVCSGQTVAESDSALAQEIRVIIRQKLQAGETSDQILRYFIGQFGESVLAEPRGSGVSLILYAAPPIALIVGVAVAIGFIRRWRRASAPGETDPGAPQALPESSDPSHPNRQTS
jgi:cytochrome c-type biogenesis protein CcmH